MTGYGALRMGAKLAALVPAFLLGLPVQALLNRLGSPLARRLPMLFHRYLCRVLGVRVHVSGAPPVGAALVVANHVSWLDIAVIGSSAPLSFIAKSDVAEWPLFGTLARLQRSVFVDRNRRTATGAAADGIAQRLAAGEIMVLFAEGTTSDGNRVLPYRSALIGAARAEAGNQPVAVVPLAISYKYINGLPITRRDRPDIAWYGDMDLLPHLKALLAGGPIDVTLAWGAPMAHSEAADRKEIARLAEGFARACLAQPFELTAKRP